jgi:HlyD family secretion protein
LARDVCDGAKTTLATMKANGIDKTNPVAYAQAEAAVAQAEVSYEQSKGGVASAKGGVASAKSGVAQAKSAVKQAKSARTGPAVRAAKSGVSAASDGVSMAQKAVDATVVRAPIAGTVLFAPSTASLAAAAQGASAAGMPGSKLEKGSAVTPGTPVFTIVNPDALSFTVEVDEADVPKLAVDQKAEITLDSFANTTYAATVSSIAEKAKTTLTGGTVFDVELDFAEADAQIRLGMKGDATIEIETLPDALTVPIEALFSEAGKDYVYGIDANNKLKRIDVVVGTTTDTAVELTEGAEAGTKVALAGSVQLTAGMRVRAKQAQ